MQWWDKNSPKDYLFHPDVQKIQDSIAIVSKKKLDCKMDALIIISFSAKLNFVAMFVLHYSHSC
jgi:hypothetical protein